MHQFGTSIEISSRHRKQYRTFSQGQKFSIISDVLASNADISIKAREFNVNPIILKKWIISYLKRQHQDILPEHCEARSEPTILPSGQNHQPAA